MGKTLKDLTSLVSSNLVIKVFGIVSVIVYTRYLAKEELALAPLFVVLGRLSMVVFSFGIMPTLVRDTPHLIKTGQTERVRSAIRTSLVVTVPGIFLFSVLCFYFSGQLSLYFLNTDAYKVHFKAMSAGFFFTGVNQAFSYIYWSLSRYQQESRRVVAAGMVQVLSCIAFVLLWGASGLIAALVLSSFINTLMFVYNLKDVLFEGSFVLYPVKKLLRESVPFYLESYLQYFRAEGDQLLVASILGPNALAVYFIAKKPYDFLYSFTQSLEKVLTTSLAELRQDREAFNKRVNNIITLNSYILFPVIFFTIGVSPSFVLLIAGGGYEAAVLPSVFLLLWLIVQLFWRTAFGKSIFILKSPFARFKITLLETLTLLFLMCILGYASGLNGIAAGRFLAAIAAGIFAFNMIKREISVKVDVKSIATITANSMAMCLILLLVQFAFPGYLVFFISLLLAIVLFLFLINRTVSDKYYLVLNSVSPVKISDPFKYLFGRMGGSGA